MSIVTELTWKPMSFVSAMGLGDLRDVILAMIRAEDQPYPRMAIFNGTPIIVTKIDTIAATMPTVQDRYFRHREKIQTGDLRVWQEIETLLKEGIDE